MTSYACDTGRQGRPSKEEGRGEGEYLGYKLCIPLTCEKGSCLIWLFSHEQALKELRAKASQKGQFGGTGMKKSGKK